MELDLYASGQVQPLSRRRDSDGYPPTQKWFRLVEVGEQSGVIGPLIR